VHCSTPKLHSKHFLAAANILGQRRLTGVSGDRLPVDMRPDNIEQAMQIQGLLASQLNDNIAGWKCGMPSAEKIVIAPIFSRTTFKQNQKNQYITCKVSDSEFVKIEPELAFIIGTDLPARALPYSEDEVLAALSHAQLALEIIGCRYTDPASASFAEQLADGLFNQGLFLGPEISIQSAMQAQNIAIELHIETQKSQRFAGVHPATQPQAPLYWLVEYLHQQGLGLRTGQAIITGSYAGSPAVPLHKHVQVQFEALGTINVRFE